MLRPEEILELKKRELALVKAKRAYEDKLPHLYSMKFYKWSREFYDSTNRVNLVCAANQISKSSTLIRRAIANATDPSRWEKMFGRKPGMFWYFYPDGNTLTKEWETKWLKEWMPRDRFDPVYGWRIEMKGGKPNAIHFNSGVHIFFQTYSQKVTSIQAGTVDEIYCDEEMPMAFFDEIMFRLTVTNGIFNAGFTPTLNQLFWKKAIEGKKVLPSALKMQISMYECLKYEDGSPSTAFTVEKIEESKRRCKSETEVQRRIYGRFVSDQGRTYYAFDFDKHFTPARSVDDHFIFSAVDYGSGGDSGHPAAIVFIAVARDYKKGFVIKAWRGDGLATTAGDIYNKYIELKDGLRDETGRVYDPGAKDFGEIAMRNAQPFMKADKSRDRGEENINTLFKYGMLELFADDHEIEKLGVELTHIMKENQAGTHKADDDLADALRYCCLQVPWDFSVIDEKLKNELIHEVVKKAVPMTEKDFVAQQIRERRGETDGKGQDESSGWAEIDEEFDFWNEQYG